LDKCSFNSLLECSKSNLNIKCVLLGLLPSVKKKTNWFRFYALNSVRNKESGSAMAPDDIVQAAPDLFFRPATLEDLDRIAQLEADGYPEDEAASRDRLQFRLENAPQFFLAAIRPANDAMIGYVCATLAPEGSTRLSEDTMATHAPEGSTLCIHSVCVDALERRKGVASKLLQAYARWVANAAPSVECMRLICKAELVPLYAKAGFIEMGPSEVVHGQDPWIEMSMSLSEN
jgi:ribosomal protein S18 acetylase RimI-like enzyme